jgi:hypothetical protein
MPGCCHGDRLGLGRTEARIAATRLPWPTLGCPGVSPPFDYVPASDAEYRAKLAEQAEQIDEDLHRPDILLMQEAEDQDICGVQAGALVCGPGGGDGRPDTLQELGLEIEDRSGARYAAALDRDGADDRGIVSGFLYRTDRVELPPAGADDPVLGSSPDVEYRGPGLAYNTDVQNPKVLNAQLPADVDRSTGTDGTNVYTRPPQVARFRIWQDRIGRGRPVELVAFSNHFSSTPNARWGSGPSSRATAPPSSRPPRARAGARATPAGCSAAT